MIYKLRITSWADRTRGYQSGATHYFGTIRTPEGERIDLHHRVRVDDPAYEDGTLWRRGYKKKTFSTSRFVTRKQVIASARRWFKKHSKPGDELVMG